MAEIIHTSTGQLALTFDDVLLQPGHSDVMPHEVDISTFITKNISLNLPIISAAMDTVTESEMAIAMAQAGGLGVIHRNMTPEQQAAEIQKVKRFECGMIINPITIEPTATLEMAKTLMAQHQISGIPVVEYSNGQCQTNAKSKGKLVGILTIRDVRFASDPLQPVSELMTSCPLVTVNEDVSQQEAKELLHKHRIEKLIVTDDMGQCTGLITIKDILRANLNPNGTYDSKGRLRVAAASTVGEQGIKRAEYIIDAGADILVIDTAHGHSQKVLDTVREIKNNFKNVEIMAGNIATTEAAEALIDCGADAIKVGIGPGSICTTRIVAGVGVPQLSAIMDVCKVAKKRNIPVIGDGGLKFSGDLAKCLAAGAAAGMVGSLLAGTLETPGETYLYQGRKYKSYRGMGSVGAMSQGSADRYFQGNVTESKKLVPEGVEGQVPYKGKAEEVLHQLEGGIRAAMGYIGAKNLSELHNKAKFVAITNAALRESHTHEVEITRESPNYKVGKN